MRLPRPQPWWAAIAIAAAVLAIAADLAIAPRKDAFDALPDAFRALAAAVVLFGVTGLPLTRLLLPASLRRHEWLWVLPVGACASGLALMGLGFAAVPFTASLATVVAGGVVATVLVLRRHGPPAGGNQLWWPVFLALAIAAVMLIPMVVQQHFATVTGDGSDAHLAAGSAHFLQQAYPTSVDVYQPVDRMPLLWKSKYPIYYAFAGVAGLAGLETWQTLVPLAAVLIALAALGMFLLAREALGAGAAVAVCAMGVAGFDRMVLHTGIHPYFNQTWGYMAMPFALVAAWWLVRPHEPPEARRRTAVLVALFSAVLAFAYPLAVPFVALPLLVFGWREWRRRAAEGRRIPRLRSIYRGTWSLLYLVPAVLVALVPLKGVNEKIRSAATLVLDTDADLGAWGGDMLAFIPSTHFFSLPDAWYFQLVLLGIGVLALRELRRNQPRALFYALGTVLVLAIFEAVQFRDREVGYYFHFKILAFAAPLLVVLAAVHLGRLRRAGPVLLAAFAVATGFAVRDELQVTGRQLGASTVALAKWTDQLPEGASVRLDMTPGRQLWAAYFLAGRRTCSQLPLLESDYPHVARSAKADYIVRHRDEPRPPDALGESLRENAEYVLYRMNPVVPGPDACSYRQDSRVQQSQIPG